MVQYLIVFPLKRRKTKLCFFLRKGVFFMGALTGKGEMTVYLFLLYVFPPNSEQETTVFLGLEQKLVWS